jgi:hypothetical protein
MAATVEADGDTHEADQHQPTDHQRVQVRHLGFRPLSPTWYPREVFLSSLDSQFVCESSGGPGPPSWIHGHCHPRGIHVEFFFNSLGSQFCVNHQRVQVRHLGFRRPSWIQAATVTHAVSTWSFFLTLEGSQFVCDFIHTNRLVIYSSYCFSNL